jgi:hypothetical protein
MSSKDASPPSALEKAYPQVACLPTDDQLVATYVVVWRQYHDPKYAPECSIKPYQTIKFYTSALPSTQEGDSIVQHTHLAVVRDRRQVLLVIFSCCFDADKESLSHVKIEENIILRGWEAFPDSELTLSMRKYTDKDTDRRSKRFLEFRVQAANGANLGFTSWYQRLVEGKSVGFTAVDAAKMGVKQEELQRAHEAAACLGVGEMRV